MLPPGPSPPPPSPPPLSRRCARAATALHRCRVCGSMWRLGHVCVARATVIKHAGGDCHSDPPQISARPPAHAPDIARPTRERERERGRERAGPTAPHDAPRTINAWDGRHSTAHSLRSRHGDMARARTRSTGAATLNVGRRGTAAPTAWPRVRNAAPSAVLNLAHERQPTAVCRSHASPHAGARVTTGGRIPSSNGSPGRGHMALECVHASDLSPHMRRGVQVRALLSVGIRTGA